MSLLHNAVIYEIVLERWPATKFEDGIMVVPGRLAQLIRLTIYVPGLARSLSLFIMGAEVNTCFTILLSF